MKIAVALFGERISPHFGSSPKMLLLEVENGIVRKKATRNVKGESPMEVARRLVNLRVQSLICGGIQRSCKDWLIGKGIAVLDNRKGEAGKLLREILHAKTNEGMG